MYRHRLADRHRQPFTEAKAGAYRHRQSNITRSNKHRQKQLQGRAYARQAETGKQADRQADAGNQAHLHAGKYT